MDDMEELNKCPTCGAPVKQDVHGQIDYDPPKSSFELDRQCRREIEGRK